MVGRAPAAEPGWTDALRGVVRKEIDRDCETLNLMSGRNGFIHNRLGAAGAAALVPALRHAQCRLTALDLGNNGLGAEGAAALVPALRHAHCRLTVLHIYDNDLDDEDEAAVMAALRAQPARALAAALQRLLFAVALRADSPRLLLAGGRVDLTRLDAARPGGGSAMPLPRAGTGSFVQYLDPEEPESRSRLDRSALLARKAAPAASARFETQGWAWRDPHAGRQNATSRCSIS